MKIKRFWAVGLLIAATLMAQGQIRFNVYYEQVINERGELADFALECLGQDNAILQSDTVYTLEKIKQVTERPANAKTKAEPSPAPMPPAPKHDPNHISSVPKYAPLSEEAALAVSPAKKAAAVAKQIFSIRETRNYLLRGEVEHFPADGKSMELMLNELKKQERALMELFLGRKTVNKKKETITVDIDANELKIEKAIARFSEADGIVPINDTTGEPLMLHIQRYTQRVPADEQPKKKKAEPVYENRIVRSSMKITYDDNVLFERVIKEK